MFIEGTSTHTGQCHKPVSSNLMISSRRLVPPVVTITLADMCLPSSMHVCEVCRANSRVGTTTRADMKEKEREEEEDER